jgi:hypothetical protein
MIHIESAIISDDIRDCFFCCDLSACKGACCVEGDAGAPLDEEEISVLEDIIDRIKPYMTAGGVKVVESYGVFDYDPTGNFCTPLVNDQECAFAVIDDRHIAHCAIEQAYLDKKVNFRKPLSCHLYPVRISMYNTFEGLNYHKWHICHSAVLNGEKNKIPLYDFLKDPLIRKYGKKWYNELIRKI